MLRNRRLKVRNVSNNFTHTYSQGLPACDGAVFWQVEEEEEEEEEKG